MFCQNCGRKNSDDALFCEGCGTSLQIVEAQNRPVIQQNIPKIKMVHKSISKLTLVIAVELLLVILVIYGITTVRTKGTTAERVAEKYFVNMVNGDWDKAFDCLASTGLQVAPEFLNEEMFATANQNTSLGIVSKYLINSNDNKDAYERDNSGFLDSFFNSKVYEDNIYGEYAYEENAFEERLVKTVEIEYLISGITESNYYSVPVCENEEGYWEVRTENLTCNNYSIFVPQGAVVTIDGVVLSQEYTAPTESDEYSEDGYLDSYIIPGIFCGTHTIEVSMEGMETVTETVNIGYESEPYYLESMHLKQETLDALISQAGENMKQIYNAAMAGKSYKNIETLFTVDEEGAQNIKESYEYLLSEWNEGSTQIDKIKFYNVKGYCSAESGYVYLEFSYDLIYTYEDWWTGKKERETYQGDNTLEFYFTKENGNWVQTNLGCEVLSF